MHELTITQSMFDLVLEHAEQSGAKKVEKVNLVIGEMTGVVTDSVEFYFNFLRQDTIAEGASLKFTTVPVKAQCKDCGKPFEPKELDWTCPHCQSNNMEIIAGKELFVESIEVE